ncbi:DEAD/DEAH box helicase [Enterococcus sp. BWT-B8]|uniref:DEAD/DEAH box helicase n=1 Tax=Enterococcus sp. BWT-B8 TaxID=2885157 RepID=UPI001E63855E|nr:DEAD/DEAH box helicase [Enterococcus sp. BWT-B8]MCB5951721.1 DEAD/DEAH box helicase [Enterococcus sp. BWT-B8]
MNELIGRKVMKKELNTDIDISSAIQLPAMKEYGDKIECGRCGMKHLKAFVQLSQNFYFCPSCIQFGRVDSDEIFYHLPETQVVPREVLFIWQGQLTDGQQEVSQNLRTIITKNRNGMIWAVTGAGKTEMLFHAIYEALEEGKRVGLASPRVDVCLELYPRIQEVFPEEPIALLHGKSEIPYNYTKLVICTTHQLLRFYQAFDLLIIDEVDAFPYVNEQILHIGAQNALKETASLIYLTATPTKELLQKQKINELETIILPARYHRRKLPVPKLKWCFQWRKAINQGKIPKQMLSLLHLLMKKNNVLLFCPSIIVLEKLYTLMKKQLPDGMVAAVHSKDEERAEKVMRMRKNEFRLFLTTTILERGVTFDQVSVMVLGAEHRVFTESALVQIAGRVDRKMIHTNGEVWFVHDGQTREVKNSIRQIQQMNKLAEEQGLVDELCLL